MRRIDLDAAQPPPSRMGSVGLAGVLAIVVLVSITGVASAGLNAGPWPMFHRDASHEALTASAAPAGPTIAWSALVSDTIQYSSPVLSSSRHLYVGDVGKELWAFDPYGTPLWHYHALGNMRYGSPAVGDNGLVYIGASDGGLYAVTENGALSWVAHAGGAIKTSPAIAPDGTIYVGADDGKLWAFNPNGTTKWSYATGDTIRSSPAIGSDGTVYFGSTDSYIYAVYPTGLLRWRGATGGPIRDCSPAIDQAGNIIIGSTDMLLYSIRPTGQINWAVDTAHQIRSSPAVGTTRVYIGVGTKIRAFHTTDGSASWTFDTTARVGSSPAVTSNGVTDYVLCGSDNGNLYEFLGTGTLVFTVPIGFPIRSSPMIGPDGMAYFGAYNKTLYAIGQIRPADVTGISGGGLRLELGPNPLRADQQLRIDLAGTDRATGGTLTIVDATGRMIRVIDMHGAAALWDGRDASGRSLPSGVYLYRFQGPAGHATGRIVRMN